jgi:hypothetical protein
LLAVVIADDEAVRGEFGGPGWWEAALGLDAVGRNVHNNFRGDEEDAMRICGYLGIAFVMFWLLMPAPMAITVAETAVQVPDATQSPSQPTPEVDLLNLQD